MTDTAIAITRNQFAIKSILAQLDSGSPISELWVLRAQLDEHYGSEAGLASFLEMLGHTLEECIEFKRCFPRKSWTDSASKPSPFIDSAQRQEALSEAADVVLTLLATFTAGEFTADEIIDAIVRKVQYNLERSDHKPTAPKL